MRNKIKVVRAYWILCHPDANDILPTSTMTYIRMFHMSVTLLRGVLDQIQSQAQQAAGQPSTRQDAPSFSDALMTSINEINKTQIEAKNKTQQWMSGSSDIGLNDVMLSMQKSSISFSFGMQMKNKIVGAYQEIMNTPV